MSFTHRNKIPRICQHCEKDFLAIPYEVNVGKARFCSRDCKKASQKGELRTSVKRECLTCKKDIIVTRFALSQGWGKYCSKECFQKSRQIEPLTLKCPTCNKDFQRYHWDVARSVSVVACSNKCAYAEMRRQSEEKFKLSGVKECPGCQREFPLDHFSKSKRERSGRTVYCKPCMRQRYRERYVGNCERRRALLKAKLVIMMGNKCIKCGTENLPICAYEFHHRDGKEKSFTISLKLTKDSESLREELTKCDLVCSICHAVEHTRYSNRPATDYFND